MATTTLDVPSIEELRARYIADVKRLKIRAGVPNPNVAPGSESYIRAQAVAAAVQLVMAREAALQNAQMGDAATGDDIVRLCNLEGISISAGGGASGYVIASCAPNTTYATGVEARSADGLRYRVVTTTIVNDGGAVPVTGIDVGKRTDKPAGAVLTWTSPPSGSNTTAVVDTSGLQFGIDADNDTSLQNKWIERKRHPPRGGNWAQVADDAKKGNSAIEAAFVYPAVYGPSTMHVAITVVAGQADAYTRAANDVLKLAAAYSVVSAHPEHADLTLTTVTDWDVDLIVKLQLSEPKSVGGAGAGWVDAAADRWPRVLNAGSPYAIALNATPSNARELEVVSDVEPVDGARIAIWSNTYKRFLYAQIASHGGLGPWTLDLYSAVDITQLAVGDWVVPFAEHLDDYAATIALAFAQLGPGQKTADVTKLPRSYRKPRVQEAWPSDISSTTFDKLSTRHSEITHVAFYRGFDSVPTTYTTLPIACPVQATTGSPPNCLRLGRLGFYEV